MFKLFSQHKLAYVSSASLGFLAGYISGKGYKESLMNKSESVIEKPNAKKQNTADQRDSELLATYYGDDELAAYHRRR